MPRLFLDFETRSRADLPKVGAWNYSLDPSTQALCVAVSNEDGNVTCYDMRFGQHPKEWELAVRDGWEIHAFNVGFEYGVVTNVLKHWPQPHLDQWRDTQAKCAASGFPNRLSGAAKALRLPELKDEGGKALIRYWCMPVASGHQQGDFREPSHDHEKWQQMLDYCAQDVRTAQAIDEALPDLSARELEFWRVTWEMNRRGIYLDADLMTALQALAASHTASIGAAMEEATGFLQANITNHTKVLSYVKEQGLSIDSVAKARVTEALNGEMSADARLVLEARRAVGRTSISKIAAAIAQRGPDGRLRDHLRANGTGTGRDTGQGVQIQNLPRGEKMDVDALVRSAKAGDANAFLAAAQVKGKSDPLGGVVTCLRAMFSATPGQTLVQCDFSAVEPRIGAWLVGDEQMLRDFRKIDREGGVDIYQMEAARFFECTPAEVVGEKRQFGKVYVLQNQYESGEASIQRSAKDQYRVELTLEEAKYCKDRWRQAHPLWVAAWHDYEKAALLAVRRPNCTVRSGRVSFRFDGSHLKLRLPSGRVSWFPWATIVRGVTPWGATKDMLEYAFNQQQSKQWVRGTTHGGALFNAVVQGTGACIMRHAAVNLCNTGWSVVLRAHDELVAECAPHDKALDTFKATMLQVPEWAPGLPLNGAGWTGPFFRKD